MFEAVLVLLFGKSVTITPGPTTIGPGEVTLQAPTPIKPVSDTMQVYLTLGRVTEDIKRRIPGPSGALGVGNLTAEICDDHRTCVPMDSGGSWFSSDSYGIVFEALGVKDRRFVAVKIRSENALPAATVRVQNYSK